MEIINKLKQADARIWKRIEFRFKKYGTGEHPFSKTESTFTMIHKLRIQARVDYIEAINAVYNHARSQGWGA